MSKADETIGFYRKMSELQERLRRSEEERLQLEEKFALLMRSCRDEEEARLNVLRERYEAFLEEEKQRRERNDRILQALDRIQSRAAILTAKSERLRLLRRHYEAYMLKMYPSWKYITNKVTDCQPSTQEFDPLSNKLNLESDRNNPYRGLGSSSLFPTDYRKRVPFMLHHDHSTVGVIPPGHQPISVNRATIDTAVATRTVDRLRLPSITLPTDSVIDAQQKLPSCAVTDRQDSVLQKELPVCTKETLNSSQNSTTVHLESNKMNELDGYLGRAAEMLKLNRAPENLSETNVSRHFSEMNPELKDTTHLGSSVNFELEQNTSGDILNVSLSDDGILQEESNRTLLSFSQKGDQNKNSSLTEQVNINIVNNTGEVMNKRSHFLENMNNEDILLNENVQFLQYGSKPAYAEQQNQETVKGIGSDAQKFKTALDNRGGGEFDNQQHLYQKNATLIRQRDSVIPNKSIHASGTVFEIEADSGLSEWKQQYSMLDDVHNHDYNLNGQKQIKGFERSEQNPKEDYYVCEDSAVRQEKKDNTVERNVEGLMKNKYKEIPANKNIHRAEGDQSDEQYKGEELGDIQFIEQKQWNENNQQYYQQYAEEQGDEYYQYRYVEGEMCQQHTESEYDEQHDEHCVDQEREQYADKVEGQCDQKRGNQNVEQYSQQYVDQERLQYNQQEQQYDQQAGHYDQQEGQHDHQYADQQYMEYQADQYDQRYEAYKQQNQKDNELVPEGQHVSEDNQTAQCEKAQEADNQEDTKEKFDQISELIQRQQVEVTDNKQESAGDVSDTSLFGDRKYQEEMKVQQVTESDVGGGSHGDGTRSAKEEKTMSKVVHEKIHDGSALPKQPGAACNLTQLSSLKNVEQCGLLLGETGEPEQSDTDELELQLAALIESQQTGKERGQQLLQSVPTGEEMEKQIPVKVASSVVENISDSSTVTESVKNMKELAIRTDIETSEIVGHEGTVHETSEAQSKMPQTSSKAENEPVAAPAESVTVKTTQPFVPRPGSKKLPGLTKMLESDTESLQLDATVSNEDSDDFDFSSDK